MQVTRCLKASRLPDVVVRVFGDEKRISFRTVVLLGELSAQIGALKLAANAERLGPRTDLTVREILLALVDGAATQSGAALQLRLAARPGEDFVRLYSSNLKQLRQNVPLLERRLMLLVDLMGWNNSPSR
ncbi:hypothetical protein [Paraburkholderia strydomiana]|uniref:Uncharacterized protein n=1 Tax=Paraburkholderia strydomiana TaxID=1245417 RepID=A0ABW9CD25_9BURK